MSKFNVGPHFFVAILTCYTVNTVLDVLPETDVHDLLRDLMRGQLDVFLHMIKGESYSRHKIHSIIECLEQTGKDFEQLKRAGKE